MKTIQLTLFGVLASAAVIFSFAACQVLAHYPVSRESRLVLSSDLHLIDLRTPETFTAPAGIYSAKLESPKGVFFVAPGGIQVGEVNHLEPKDGGIFIPKDCGDIDKAYFFVGVPPSVRKLADFWHDISVTEGCDWHLEPNPTLGSEPPKDWEALVKEWITHYDSGKWQIIRYRAPVARNGAPAGWFISIDLCEAGIGPAQQARYPQIVLCVVLQDGAIAWSMERARITKQGRFITVLPPDQLLWTPVPQKAENQPNKAPEATPSQRSSSTPSPSSGAPQL